MEEAYDLLSIMHYGATDFSKKPGAITIMPKKKPALIKWMGQRTQFSAVDLRKINKLYQCSISHSEDDNVSKAEFQQMPITIPSKCIPLCIISRVKPSGRVVHNITKALN